MADNVPKVGRMIEGEAFRDAIHVAVAPVVAGETLLPAQRVGLDLHGLATSKGDPIGIVDPFLKDDVPAGYRFWIFLFPDTITNLRHQWSHPAFKVRTPERLS